MSRTTITRAEQRRTLLDFVAVGFLNAVIALPTGFLLWLALNGFPVGWVGWLPVQSVAWFTLLVVVIGAFLQDAWLAELYGRLWRFLTQWFSGGADP